MTTKQLETANNCQKAIQICADNINAIDDILERKEVLLTVNATHSTYFNLPHYFSIKVLSEYKDWIVSEKAKIENDFINL
jgi:hypothetical protein